MNVNDLECGCLIDGSHIKPVDFNIRVVEFAIGFGYPIDQIYWQSQIDDLQSNFPDFDLYDLQELIYEESQFAISWLNDLITDSADKYFHVEDQSLYLSGENDE